MKALISVLMILSPAALAQTKQPKSPVLTPDRVYSEPYEIVGVLENFREQEAAGCAQRIGHKYDFAELAVAGVEIQAIEIYAYNSGGYQELARIKFGHATKDIAGLLPAMAYRLKTNCK